MFFDVPRGVGGGGGMAACTFLDVLAHHEMSYTVLMSPKRTKQLSTVAHDGQTLLCDLSFHPVKLRNADWVDLDYFILYMYRLQTHEPGNPQLYLVTESHTFTWGIELISSQGQLLYPCKQALNQFRQSSSSMLTFPWYFVSQSA